MLNTIHCRLHVKRKQTCTLGAVTWDYFIMVHVTDSGKLKLISLTITGESLLTSMFTLLKSRRVRI